MKDFFQDGPLLGNQFQDDAALQGILRHVMGEEVFRDVEPDLTQLGERAVGDIAAWGDDAEAHPPVLTTHDPWGRRIDRIDVARGWRELERIAAEEGIVATAYERERREHSRIHQLAKLYLFTPSSAIYSCPLAMTDGAARLIEVHGDAYLKQRVLPRLTTRDTEKFWTSGQWMTEKAGGSDLSQAGTIAIKASDGFQLHGVKWFTSATTSPMAMTLARISEPDGSAVMGSRGLSLFYLETQRPDGSWNGITVHRLKDKLGTRALPTAELTMEGTHARLIGAPGEGVKRIVTLVNVTRVYNAVCAVAGMRRALALARDYSVRRKAFGRALCDQPLHVETLAKLEVELRGGIALVFQLAALMGKEECGLATTEESAVLRILTPLAKLYTGKQVVEVTSEVLESFGGAGYVEDTGLPRLLRDAQVLPIWEGTTNVLSLDVLRSMDREGTLPPLLAHLNSCIRVRMPAELKAEIDKVRQAIKAIEEFSLELVARGPEVAQAAARGFAFSLARTSIAAFLINQAARELAETGEAITAIVAKRWCRRHLTPMALMDDSQLRASRALAMGLGVPAPTHAKGEVSEPVTS